MLQLCERLGISKVATAGYNPTGNAVVERFHRYLGASLCIVYEKKLPNWDDYLPAVLFSYRVSVNESTGYSPYFMQKGRHPVLPAHAQFSYLREPEKSEKDYVERITASLDFAFDRARNLQYAMAERNKLRQPDNQYKSLLMNPEICCWSGRKHQAKADCKATSEDGKAIKVESYLES
jgi:transposase InsO family protein